MLVDTHSVRRHSGCWTLSAEEASSVEASWVTLLFCPLPSRTAWAAHSAAGCGIDPICLAAGGPRPYQGATTCGQARAGIWGVGGHKAYFVWLIYPLHICTQTCVLPHLLFSPGESSHGSNFYCFGFFLAATCVTYGILVPQPGIEPVPSAVKPWGPHHWTTREFLK